MWMRSEEGKKGFSIVELMVVIVILSGLTMLGLSRYYAFITKGRQAEARLNLKAIADLQETWRYENERYNAEGKSTGVGAFSSDQCSTSNNGEQMKNELGFRPKDCGELRYGYWWTGGTTGEAFAESTTRDTKFIFPGCAQTDKWTVGFKKGKIKQGANDDVIEKCSD